MFRVTPGTEAYDGSESVASGGASTVQVPALPLPGEAASTEYLIAMI